MKIIEVSALKKYYSSKGIRCRDKEQDIVRALDGISFSVDKGEVFGIAGESGCGKSTLARLVLCLEKPTEGTVYFNNERIDNLSAKAMIVKRRDLQMIFQNSTSSFDPSCRIGEIIAEPIINYEKLNKKELNQRVIGIMEAVGLSKELIKRFPFELSGGQRQRVCIARALCLKPEAVICDEPVSSLDYMTRQQVMNLMMELKERFNLTYILISHDISVIEKLCGRVAVMYLGNIVEILDAKNMYKDAVHPYTKMLLSSIPVSNPLLRRKGDKRSFGDISESHCAGIGCSFLDRCTYAGADCRNVKPDFIYIDDKHGVACHEAIRLMKINNN